MTDRPYTLLSCAMSIDGYIDDLPEWVLSSSDSANVDWVDEVRASCDAILVGANTLWRNNPSLLVQSDTLRRRRTVRGLPSSPVKAAVTARGDIDPSLRFFSEGNVEKIVYCTTPAVAKAQERLGDAATVVDAGDPIGLRRLLANLARRGVRRLVVEGGGAIATQFLTEGLADELQLVIAPYLVGDSSASRFVDDGTFASLGRGGSIQLAEVSQIGDLVLLRYGLSGRFVH